ncbi:MAG: MscS family membrane protein [Flavobacteriaceae bacterium]|jgi:MscS family membrane protein
MKQIFIALFTLCLTASLVTAQNLSSPYEAIYTHLYNLQKDSYNPEISQQAIPLSIEDPEKRMEVAIHLKQILDGKGLYIYMDNVPKQTDYIDSTQNAAVYVLDDLEPRIYLEKTGDSWRYSQETIDRLNVMYGEVFPFGTKTFSRILPASTGNKHLFGLYVWQWFGLLVLSALGIFFYFLVNKIINFILHYALFRKKNIKLESETILNKIAKAFSLFVAFYTISKITPSLEFPPLILQYIVKSIAILLTFLGAAFVIRVFNMALQLFKPHIEKTSSKLDDQLLPIASKLFKILVAIITFSIALKQLDVNLTAILAGLSIGGLALALASQDTVKNFIGTITILLDHPFELGDYIIISGSEGTVEQVGMRATRIRTPAQSLAYIPNGELSNMIVDNLGLRVYRRWRWNMGVEYGTKPEVLRELCIRAKETINENSWVADEKTTVTVSELGGSSINIFVNIFLDIKSYDAELASKHELILQLITLAEEMKVEFAFPTQTLHIKK